MHCISRSNETIQNALALLVQFWQIFEIFFIFQEFQNFELRYFSSNLGGIFNGVNVEERTTENFFEIATAIF